MSTTVPVEDAAAAGAIEALLARIGGGRLELRDDGKALIVSVELNTMPSDVFIRFLERKLVQHGVKKLVPDADVLTALARHVMERALTNKALAEVRAKASADASEIRLPDDLEQQVADDLADDQKRPWDLAVAKIATDAMDAEADAAEWERWAAGVAADLDTLCWRAA